MKQKQKEPYNNYNQPLNNNKMKNQSINTTTEINDVLTMSREELIFKTKVGSLIAFANFKTFNHRKAIFLILKDEKLTTEVCKSLKWDKDLLENMMCAQMSAEQEELAKTIGDILAATMATEAAW